YHVWESRPRQVRHRMTVFAACVGAARTAISHLEHLSGSSEAVASACARVAVLARRLAASQTDNGNVGEGQEQRDERFTWTETSSAELGEDAPLREEEPSGDSEQSSLLALRRLARL